MNYKNFKFKKNGFWFTFNKLFQNIFDFEALYKEKKYLIPGIFMIYGYYYVNKQYWRKFRGI